MFVAIFCGAPLGWIIMYLAQIEFTNAIAAAVAFAGIGLAGMWGCMALARLYIHVITKLQISVDPMGLDHADWVAHRIRSK